MADPLSPDFWQSENAALNSVTAELAMTVLVTAAENAISQLPAGAQMLVNWDLINQDVLRYLNGPYLQQTIPGLNATTLRQIRPIIEDWIRSGEHLRALEARLGPIFGDVRASRIASTEITRLWADSSLISWGSSGMVSGKKWQTVRSDVCPLCVDLHDRIVDLTAEFIQTPAELANTPELMKLYQDEVERFRQAQNLLRWNGGSVLAPPRHVNCRCYILPITSMAMIEQELDRALGLFGTDAINRRIDRYGRSLVEDFFAKAGKLELVNRLKG